MRFDTVTERTERFDPPTETPLTHASPSNGHQVAMPASHGGPAEAKAPIDSLVPATTDNPDLSDQWPGFFEKPVEEIHLEHARREAPELNDEVVLTPVARKVVDHRVRSLVYGILGVAAIIGCIGLVQRASARRSSSATPIAAVVTEEKPVAETTVGALLASPQVAADPPHQPSVVDLPPLPTVVAAPPPTAAEAPAAANVTVVETEAPAAPAAEPPPGDDPDAALSGPQLVARARQVLRGGNNSRAAVLAGMAIAKGGGGSAWYLLGAANQLMGANGPAKGAYQRCARSGCPEAAECASIASYL